MKRRLRQKVWWPSIDKQVEGFIKKCKQCILVSSLGPPEPVKSTKMPEKPWEDLAVDFMGPLPSGHTLFVIVDYFSRFTEAIVMQQTTAKRTVQALHETFCRFGVPESVKSDNGPQFISEEMKSFFHEFGILHRRTTPYWPQANGEVERANGTILKHLKISQQSGSSDWMWDLRSFLLMYNSTPHATTGVAPSVLMFNRTLRDKLPHFSDQPRRMEEEEIRDRDCERKSKDVEYANSRRHAKPTEISEGDTVVAKRTFKENKLSSTYAPEEFVVTKLVGTNAELKSVGSGRTIHRNVAHLKPVPSAEPNLPDDQTTEESQTDNNNISTENIEARTNQEQDDPMERPLRVQRKPAYLSDYHTNAVNIF